MCFFVISGVSLSLWVMSCDINTEDFYTGLTSKLTGEEREEGRGRGSGRE